MPMNCVFVSVEFLLQSSSRNCCVLRRLKAVCYRAGLKSMCGSHLSGLGGWLIGQRLELHQPTKKVGPTVGGNEGLNALPE